MELLLSHGMVSRTEFGEGQAVKATHCPTIGRGDNLKFGVKVADMGRSSNFLALVETTSGSVFARMLRPLLVVS